MSSSQPKKPTTKTKVTLAIDSQSNQRRAWAKSHLPDVEIVSSVDAVVQENEVRVVVTDQRVELWDHETPHGRGTFADFSHIDTRTGSGNLGRQQPLHKAIGTHARHVVDATAGFGQDAVLLACMGFQVTAFERNPVIAAILFDGLQRGKLVEALTEPLSQLDLVMADAKEGLSKLVDRPDVVYIDGMFPVKRSKAALAKKPMRLARRLVGEDDDLPELLAIARRFALNRVVVKRPQSAKPLSTAVSSRLKTKLVSYDIYPPSEPKCGS